MINKSQIKTKFKHLLKPMLVKLINLYLHDNADFSYYENFDYWQNNGFHLIPNHFYQPIPDTSKIKSSHFNIKSQLLGVDMKDKHQLAMLKKLNRYKNEYSCFSKIKKSINDQEDPNFYFGNIAFDGMDAIIYYYMIRSLRPANIIEVGSGWSTKIAAYGCIKNKNTSLTAIDPYPQPILHKGIPGLTKLVVKNIEDVPISYFQKLKENDILFIDSSHTVKTAGDVNYLYLNVLSTLNKGVYIHIHDIFFPYDYSEKWVIQEHRFWTEQYLLQAFLMFNDSFEVVFSNSYICSNYKKEVRRVISETSYPWGGSIWLKRIK